MTGKFTADYLLGRRFEFVAGGPDVTVIGLDPRERTVYLHSIDGGRQHLPLGDFVDAIRRGALIEAMAAPFVLERETKFDRRRSGLRKGIAGRGKVLRFAEWVS